MRRIAVTFVLGLLLLTAFVYWPMEAPKTGGWMAAAGVEPRYETLDGRRVRYVRRGSGPPVLLLHGIASSLYTWKELLPGLAADHDVVALDFPGFGDSDVPPAMSVELLHDTVVGLMDRLALPQATLVGNSLGGAVASVVAAREPDRVSRLVLIDSAGFRMAAESRPALLRYAAGPLGSLLLHVPRPRPLLSIGLRQVFFDDRLVTPERVDEYEAPLLRPGALAAMRSMLRAPAPGTAEYEAILRGVQQPTLVLWGAEDRWIPPSDADLYSSALPRASKVVLSECGHMPQEERPDETLRLVREFIAAPREAGR